MEIYNIGDKIVYPMHGAGIIDAIEEKEVLGEIRSYYYLKLPYGNLRLMVPVDNIEELGIRRIMPKSDIPAVLDKLAEPCDIDNTNWNKRHRDNLDRLRSGNIFEVVEVYKFLALRDKSRNLSTGEKKMLSSAKNILFSEILLSSEKEVYEVEALIRQAMGDFK